MRFVRYCAAALVAACGSQHPAPPPPAAPALSIEISPGEATLDQGATQAFVAHVTGGDLPVAWSAAAGTITRDGTYSPPEAAGTYTVSATAGAMTASAKVTVREVSISISPGSAALAAGDTLLLHADVAGAVDHAVVWSASAGTIDASGAFVAPTAGGIVQITAASRADPSRTASSTITVVPPPPPPPAAAVAISPAAANVEEGAQQKFTATMPVNWSADAGSIDANGVFTAPRAPGAVQVVATSVTDPTRKATAAVLVTVPAVTLTISPVAATVTPDTQLQFTAMGDAHVTWSSDCCAVASDGTFIAPFGYSVVHVAARSVSDPAQTATATITIAPGAAINPAAVTVHPGDRVAFTSTDPAPTWAVAEGAAGGSVTNGVYQAPLDHGGTFHVVTQTASAVVTVLPPDLVDHGGPTLPATRTFAVWWGDMAQWNLDVHAAQELLLRGLGGSDYLRISEQYLRGASATTSFAGHFADTSAAPTTAVDAKTVGAIACSALLAGGAAPATGDVAIVYGSSQLSPAPSWCAWHSSVTCAGVTLFVAFVPNPSGACLKLATAGSCNAMTAQANATASLTAHELIEIMTDPLLNAWVDAAGQEIGDKCEDQPRCVSLSTGAFQLQAEYSNAVHACVP